MCTFTATAALSGGVTMRPRNTPSTGLWAKAREARQRPSATDAISRLPNRTPDLSNDSLRELKQISGKRTLLRERAGAPETQ